MIPTIDDILAGYEAGTFSMGEAVQLIEQHVELARRMEADRCMFAGQALQGLLATGTKPPSKMALVQEAFAWADCMVECANGAQG